MSMHQGACGGGGFRWSRIGHERDRTGEISAALAGPAIRHNPWEYWTLGHGTVLDGTRISVFKTVAIVRSAIPPPTKLHAANVFEVRRPLMERARWTRLFRADGDPHRGEGWSLPPRAARL